MTERLPGLTPDYDPPVGRGSPRHAASLREMQGI